MLYYLLFIIRCILGKFKFFKMSPLKKAKFLIHCNLFFEAGKIYLKKGHYTQALDCFQKCHAHRHAFLCYQKLGQVSLALEIADTHKLYRQGARLCVHTQNDYKAAYFYSYFDMPQAIKLYKKLGAHYELGHCYLVTYRFYAALQAFLNCKNPSQKLIGLQLIEEIAIVLYLNKYYQDAIKLFIGLNDSYSVLECAKKLKDTRLIEQTSRALAQQEFEEGNLLHAAYHIAPYNRILARLYYYLHQLNDQQLTHILDQQRYYEALSYCFHTNQFLLAKEISRYWLSQERNPLSLSA